MKLSCNIHYHIKNNICVDTGKIITSDLPLYTEYIYSCSVLAFEYVTNNKKKYYMAHVDMSNANMEQDLIYTLEPINLNEIDILHIWTGEMCNDNCNSFNMIIRVLDNFKIDMNKIKYHTIKWNEEATIPL